jgi:hypothetical protein
MPEDRWPRIFTARRLKRHFNVFYDEKGAVGRRYRRQDEAGTPYCITVDGQTLRTKTVTIRDRDTLRILRYGDMIALGRSVLLFGARDQIAARLAELRGEPEGDLTKHPGESKSGSSRASPPLDFELSWSHREDIPSTMHLLEPPDLPERLGPGQAAQLSELLEYLHLRIRRLLQTVESDEKAERITLDARRWQDLLDLQARLAEYIREIGEPR